jgi:hypothetical protein
MIEPPEEPGDFVYRGITVRVYRVFPSRQDPRDSDPAADQTPVPEHSWQASGDSWAIFAPSVELAKRALDSVLDGPNAPRRLP